MDGYVKLNEAEQGMGSLVSSVSRKNRLSRDFTLKPYVILIFCLPYFCHGCYISDVRKEWKVVKFGRLWIRLWTSLMDEPWH